DKCCNFCRYIFRIRHHTGKVPTLFAAFFLQNDDTRPLKEFKNLDYQSKKWKTKSKHSEFIEFESPEVANIVTDRMHNYLLFEHLLQVHITPTKKVHPKQWYGVTHRYKPLNWTQIERNHHNKERSLEEHRKLVEGIMNFYPLSDVLHLQDGSLDEMPPLVRCLHW
ncbi:hypothetical protein MKX01_012215, partial [Papaver californicum]